MGNTVFKLQAAGLDFKGQTQHWLVVDQYQAFYQGTGSLNGTGGYSFMVSVLDGDLMGKKMNDRVRVMIWSPQGILVYDNQRGDSLDATPATALGGGNVVIHSGGKKGKEHKRTCAAANPVSLVSVYPNPLSAEGLWLAFPALEEQQEVQAVVYDLSGRIVAYKRFTIGVDGGRYHWDVDHSQWAKGVYVLSLKGASVTEKIKIVK